jgi:predicted nucleic acid-binding protein
MDLVIAATANVIGVTLVTENLGDFEIIQNLVDLRSPEQLRQS